MATDITSYLANQQPSQVVSGATGTGASLVAGQKNLTSSYETFLTLLTTQLKNQDPTSPLDTNAFTQQLVQMTGVQQQLLSNQLLQSLVDQSSSQWNLGAVDLIGKAVTVGSSTSTLKDGAANWTYTLPTAAKSATLNITDGNNRVVWSGPASSLAAGDHSFTWDGKSPSGADQPAGTYKLSIDAKDSADEAIDAQIAISGVVSGITESASGTLVTVNGTQTALSNIKSVRQPS